ncbi:glycosyltransferase family 2 protein [[Limnothrix rosea] IAM M-220]|uniref:glycosyltransferase family 2 protein n=1 Tax=[Limnothrix rosea] IAM M-220 TaxID=454133 RepID=UPI00096130F1|nr:glycosyltransferase family 2 protein [[Limnothrix rosea] IAM M-220]OKH17852.1 glycosyltransferase [[Limnothrix rosea] IAM M-220]
MLSTAPFVNNSASSVTTDTISVVVPIYNEVESLPHLITAIADVMQANNYIYEIVCVDDGSRDGSTALLQKLAEERDDLRAIVLRRNYGQTPAMAAGFENAAGEVVISLDADLQNDPADIPNLLIKMDEGYDLVSGWRKDRQDNKWTRLIPSKIANLLIGRVTKVTLHDYGCSLKAYRSELLADINLYGELHRFIPALASIEGARIAEIPVRHHARQFGNSKYGLDRTFRVLLDLLTVWFIRKFLTRPMHAFGYLGLLMMSLGTMLGLYLSSLKVFLGQSIGDRPLLVLVAILFLAGLQLFGFGLLGELLMRTYHESQGRPIYRIRSIFGTSKYFKQDP